MLPRIYQQGSRDVVRMEPRSTIPQGGAGGVVNVEPHLECPSKGLRLRSRVESPNEGLRVVWVEPHVARYEALPRIPQSGSAEQGYSPHTEGLGFELVTK